MYQFDELVSTCENIRIVARVKVGRAVDRDNCRVDPVFSDPDGALRSVRVGDDRLAHNRGDAFMNPALEVRLGSKESERKVKHLRRDGDGLAVNLSDHVAGVERHTDRGCGSQ